MGGGASDCNRHPLLQSEEPMWKVMHPPPKLTSSHCIRGWHSLVYKHLSYMGQVYQSLPMQAHPHMRFHSWNWVMVSKTRLGRCNG